MFHFICFWLCYATWSWILRTLLRNFFHQFPSPLAQAPPPSNTQSIYKAMCVFGQATILWNSLQFVSSSSSSITCGSAFLSYYELNCCHQVVVIHINIYFLHVDDCCAECWQPLYFLSFWGMQAVERREHYKYINECNYASSSLMKRII